MAPRDRWPLDTGTLTRQRQYISKVAGQRGWAIPNGPAMAGTNVALSRREDDGNISTNREKGERRWLESRITSKRLSAEEVYD